MARIVIPWKKLLRVAAVTVVLLLVPLVASFFSAGVDWSAVDYVIAGLLLFGAGATFELIARRGAPSVYRFAVATAVGACLLLGWGNLAVGLIGNEENPASLLYLAVPAVGLVGAGISRFHPAGMARTALVMAIVQALVPFVAMAIWRPVFAAGPETAGVVRVLMLNGFFVALFAASALMFRKAAEPTPTV